MGKTSFPVLYLWDFVVEEKAEYKYWRSGSDSFSSTKTNTVRLRIMKKKFIKCPKQEQKLSKYRPFSEKTKTNSMLGPNMFASIKG